MNQHPSLPKKIYYSPLARIIAGLIVCVGVGTLAQIGIKSLLSAADITEKITQSMVLNLAGMIAVTVSYIILFSYYERRKITELSFDGLLPNASLGCAIGGGMQSLVILVLYLCGYYSIVTVNRFPESILPALVLAIASGISEEVIFRGILFRLSEEKLGSLLALVLTSGLFGFAHIFNPNATVYSAVAIAVEAGIVLGAAYMATRSLWLPIFIHISWNFTEGGIFGAALSGHTMRTTLITSSMHGPDILTGGSFGPENSVIAVGLSFGVGLLLLRRARRHGQIVPPVWHQSVNPAHQTQGS